MWHLPILQQYHLLKMSKIWFNTFKQLRTVEVAIKHSNKEFQKILSPRARRLGRQSHIKKVSADESLKQRLTEEKERIESELQKFKTYEGFCEAAPQFILQGSLWLVLRSSSGLPFVMKMTSLSFSFGSLVFAAAGVCIKNPFIIVTQPQGEQEVKVEAKVPFHAIPLWIVIPLLTAVVMPRLMSLCMISSKAKGWPFGVMIVLTIICHCTLYLLIMMKVRNLSLMQLKQRFFERRLLSENILISVITSLIVPCVVIDSEYPWLMISSISSTMAHILLLILFLITLHFFPDTLRPW